MAASLISDDDQIKSEVNNSNNPNQNFQYFTLFPHKPSGEEARNDMQYAKKG